MGRNSKPKLGEITNIGFSSQSQGRSFGSGKSASSDRNAFGYSPHEDGTTSTSDSQSVLDAISRSMDVRESISRNILGKDSNSKKSRGKKSSRRFSDHPTSRPSVSSRTSSKKAVSDSSEELPVEEGVQEGFEDNAFDAKASGAKAFDTFAEFEDAQEFEETHTSRSSRAHRPSARKRERAPETHADKDDQEAIEPKKKSKSHYIPALDGLRAFAVIAVVLYHMNTNFLPSGLLGVTLFFVLSGYLITGILIKEWRQTGKLNLPTFWIHRVRRLFPAIVFMLCTVLVVTAFIGPDLLTKLRKDLFPALFWFTNWWYIFQDTSYFEAMGAPSPVNHFWSLAIEEQFYVIWPPILLLLFRSKVKKNTIQRLIVVLAIVSVALMMFLYVPGGDPSRVYYGTDTRAFSLLIGAFLAFAFPSHRVCGKGKKGLNPGQRKTVGLLGLVAFAAIIVMMIVVDAYSPFSYYGGILITSLLTGMLILALVDKRNLIAKFFSLPPLVYLGKISYGVYIWHYPILLIMTDFNAASETAWYWHILQAIVILAVSAFSYHFVEQPIRKGRLGVMYHEIKDKTTTFGQVIKKHIVYVVCTVALVVGAVVACIVVPDTTTQQNTTLGEGVVIPEGAMSEGDQSGEGEGAVSGQDINEASDVSQKDYLLSKLGTNPALPNLSMETLQQLVDTKGATQTEKAGNTQFLLIGDSVTAAFAYEDAGYGNFSKIFPNATLDSIKNRSMGKGPEVYNYYKSLGWNGPVVMIELATNSTVKKERVIEMLDTIPEGKMVFLINGRSRLAHQVGSNKLLAEIAAERGNVEIIDWYATSEGHGEYFDGDGTHLTPKKGCNAYQQMLLIVLETLYSNAPTVDESQTDGADSGEAQSGEPQADQSSSDQGSGEGQTA